MPTAFKQFIKPEPCEHCGSGWCRAHSPNRCRHTGLLREGVTVSQSPASPADVEPCSLCGSGWCAVHFPTRCPHLKQDRAVVLRTGPGYVPRREPAPRPDQMALRRAKGGHR